MERLPDPASLDLDAAWDQAWDQQLLERAMAVVRAKVKPLSYQMFELKALKQWPANKVARRLGVTMGKVYYAEYTIRRLISKEVRKLEALAS